jgi:hypothetical protein
MYQMQKTLPIPVHGLQFVFSSVNTRVVVVKIFSVNLQVGHLHCYFAKEETAFGETILRQRNDY